MKISRLGFSEMIDKGLGTYFFFTAYKDLPFNSVVEEVSNVHRYHVACTSGESTMAVDLSNIIRKEESDSVILGVIPKMMGVHNMNPTVSVHVPPMRLKGFSAVQPMQYGNGRDIKSAIKDFQSAMINYVSQNVVQGIGTKRSGVLSLWLRKKMMKEEDYNEFVWKQDTYLTILKSIDFYPTLKELMRFKYSYDYTEQCIPNNYMFAGLIDDKKVWGYNRKDDSTSEYSVEFCGCIFDNNIFYPHYSVAPIDQLEGQVICASDHLYDPSIDQSDKDLILFATRSEMEEFMSNK